MRFTYAEAMTQAKFYAPLAQAAEAAGYTSMTVADSLIYPKDSASTARSSSRRWCSARTCSR
jgi:alkanesulfonate monooxygenase SsuD/methylene tetrahydromethanopterin reductase-like flavin-dependent oxidoreductase (luciferase family)